MILRNLYTHKVVYGLQIRHQAVLRSRHGECHHRHCPYLTDDFLDTQRVWFRPACNCRCSPQGRTLRGIPRGVHSGRPHMVQDPEVHFTLQVSPLPNGLHWVRERKMLAGSSLAAGRGDPSPSHTPTTELVHPSASGTVAPSRAPAALTVSSSRAQPAPGHTAGQPGRGAWGTCEKTRDLLADAGDRVELPWL